MKKMNKMEHKIIFKDKNLYSSFPLITQLEDELKLEFFVAPFVDHYGIYKWKVMSGLSDGSKFFPYIDSFTGEFGPRFDSDKFSNLFPNGNLIEFGSPGFKGHIKHSFKEKRKFEKQNTNAIKFKYKKSNIYVTYNNSIFLIKSNITGKKEKIEYPIEGVKQIITFPRHIEINDHTFLISAYGILENNKSINFICKSYDGGQNWKIFPMYNNHFINGNEMAFVKIKNKILALIRKEDSPFLMESWSDDEGWSWSHPIRTNICGFPPHLLKLKDGRILCSYGYRFDKMGIRAVISEDGKHWSKPIILREDAGYSSSLHKKKLKIKDYIYAWNDIGYPISIQLKDESIFTVYYITNKDRITHIASTKWNLNEVSI